MYMKYCFGNGSFQIWGLLGQKKVCPQFGGQSFLLITFLFYYEFEFQILENVFVLSITSIFIIPVFIFSL